MLATHDTLSGNGYECCSFAWTARHLIYTIDDSVFAYRLSSGARQRLARISENAGNLPRPWIVGVSRRGDLVAYVSAVEPRFVYVASIGGTRRWRVRLPAPKGRSWDAETMRVAFR